MVCCVCDCIFPASEVAEKVVDRIPVLLQSMCQRLKPPMGLPPALVEYYNVATVSSHHRGILLSKAGVKTDSTSIFSFVLVISYEEEDGIATQVCHCQWAAYW